ncbi:glycogen debranching protein GlgX [Desertihabitans brevis]|uniref:glycogen debranching protein GlgX n=1 Tax=Desertihabitans brevis TaxID=2268447 RepID=UPI0038994F2A
MTRVSTTRPDQTSLGARPTATGTRFALWAPGASAVQLCLVAEDGGERRLDTVPADDGTWQLEVPGVGPGQRYGYRAAGPWEPARGLRFNPAKLLLDPWARAVSGSLDLDGAVRDHLPGQPGRIDDADSLGAVPLSVVVGEVPRPRPLAGPRPTDPVVYEAHLAGTTRLHPDVPERLRGSYAGFASPAVVQHLRDLGVTTVELLPVQHFVTEPHLVAKGLTNYWGYNTVGFFAPHAGYSSSGDRGGQVAEFAELVSTLHDAGLEVVLDVVYNHTGEGDRDGPTLSFRGLGPEWYRLDAAGHQVDVTGCGNSVDTSHPVVLDFVLASLRHWVTELGVDGFRFDLAPTLLRDDRHAVDLHHAFLAQVRTDPVLSGVRLISEPWDVGVDGYQVGRFGRPWLEWNDRFRDDVRDYWRGAGDVRRLATRLAGSTDLFDPTSRGTSSTVNFVTAHDGFTLRDLVSYHHKHNRANGEHGRDGSDANRSVNHGVEGETDDAGVVAARRRHARALMATLLVSAGTPMITAGDELGRTQQGNNNAYCQDNEISWTDWSKPWSDLHALTRELLRLRREHPLLRPPLHPVGRPVRDATGADLGRLDLAWLTGAAAPSAPGGVETMTEQHWHDPHRQLLGMYLSDAEEALLVWCHCGGQTVDVPLPGGLLGTGWRLLLDAGGDSVLVGGRLRLAAPTVAVLQSTDLPR